MAQLVAAAGNELILPVRELAVEVRLDGDGAASHVPGSISELVGEEPPHTVLVYRIARLHWPLSTNALSA